ncbi:hypothetical protein K2X85_01150 [bacterium]|nr:hypothetical protein [bacterium]
MRSDMARLLVERPRLGSQGKKPKKGYLKNWQRQDIELAPSHEGIARLRGKTKCLNEYLSPLRRYLFKQVGRPWDDVFHEMSQNIRLDNAIQKHVLDHVWEFIQTKVTVRGEVFCHGQQFRGRKVGEPIHTLGKETIWRGSFLYVCPRTGILREALYQRPSTRKRLVVQNVPIDASRGYHRADGIWYEVEFVPWTAVPGTFREANLQRPAAEITWSLAKETYGRAVLAVRRWQLSSREIRKLEWRIRSSIR